MACKPDLFVNYRGYAPPHAIEPIVDMLLGYVPAQYLAGVRYIELTNSNSARRLRRGKTWSRRRKVPMVRCCGFYYGDHIQIVVDNLIRSTPAWMRRSHMMRTLIIGSAGRVLANVGVELEKARVDVMQLQERGVLLRASHSTGHDLLRASSGKESVVPEDKLLRGTDAPSAPTPTKPNLSQRMRGGKRKAYE